VTVVNRVCVRESDYCELNEVSTVVPCHCCGSSEEVREKREAKELVNYLLQCIPKQGEIFVFYFCFFLIIIPCTQKCDALTYCHQPGQIVALCYCILM